MKITDVIKEDITRNSITEDSLGLEKLHNALWTVISEQTIDEETINEIDPGMIANLYSVFPTVAKIIVSNALTKARKEAKETSNMIDVMKKHANSQPVTPQENEAMLTQFKDIVSYGLSAVAGVLTATVAGPAAGAGVALAGAYKKELLTLLQTKGPQVLIGLLKSKGKLDVVDILSANLLGKHVLPFYAAPTKPPNSGIDQQGNKIKEQNMAEGSLREQASKLLSAQDKDGIITIIVQAPDGTKRSASSSNPNAINKWLMKYGLRLPKNIADLFVGVTEEFRPTAGQAMGIRNQIAQKMNPGSSKFIWKRPNQIMGSHTENELRALKFRYSAKHNSWGGTQQMWGQLEGNLKEFAPTKPPTAGAFGGNKDYGQPTSSRYSNGNKFVLGTTNNYVLTATVDKWGLEWDEDNNIWYLDSPGAAHIADATEGEIELPAPQEQRNQIHDLVTDYLNDHNSAELQQVAAYYGHSADGEMATSEGVRVPAQQILGTKNRAKSAYYPTNVKPKVPKLDTPLTDKELARLSQLAGIDTNK